MSAARFTDTDAIDELAAWWREATRGSADAEVSGAELTDFIRRLLDRVRPDSTPLLSCPECSHDLAEHYGQRRRESHPTPRLCRATKDDGRSCRCRYTMPQMVADAPTGGGYRALPRIRLMRLSGRRHPRQEPLSSAREVFDVFKEEAAGLTKEVFWTVLLDGRNRVIDIDETAVGSLTATLVHPREVFSSALYIGAAAVILAHNHPSGDPEPSPEDRALTTRLVQAGDLMGIRVLDHVVIGDGRYRSFSEQGLI